MEQFLAGPQEPSVFERVQVAPEGASLLDADGHICAFFHSADEEYRVLLPFIKAGFERGERAFHILDPARREQHVRRLSDAGLDVASAEARGQLVLRDWSQAHLRDGHFDQERMFAFLAEARADARRHGYARTRFVSHMEWALASGPVTEELAEYEARCSGAPRNGDVAICVYRFVRWGGQTLVDAIRTHSQVIIGGCLHENPFFQSPAEFLTELRAFRETAAN
jgi:hypothetical protein